MIERALWSQPVDATYTMQDCVLEFLYKTYGATPYDETPESAASLNVRLHWHEETERRFANTVYEVTFAYKTKRFRATVTENHLCSIWREPKRKGRA